MTSCDLRTAPLFSVLDPHEGVRWVGLRELFACAHDLTDLSVTVPPAAAAVLRVLYTIAARVTGLDAATTAAEWAARRRDVIKVGRFDERQIDDYFARHDDRWDLFDQTWPWLQDPRLASEAELKSANVLDPTRPGDNSPIWWRHTHDGHAPAIPVAEALQWLMIHHFYGSGGTGGSRTVGATSSQHMSAGPLRATLTFSPLGTNLFETIIAGLPSPSSVPDHQGDDSAPWEAATRHDPLTLPPRVTWPAELLVGRSRHALLLVPDDPGTAVTGCYLTWAWKQRHAPIEDPYMIQNRRADGDWQPRTADATRAVWRDVDALLADRADHQRPAILTAALSLPDRLQDTLRVRAHGFDQDRRAVNTAWFTATTPPLLTYMTEHEPERANGATALHEAAEDIAGVMRSSLRTAYRSLGTGESPKKRSADDVPWIAPAENFYWPAAETLFWTSLEASAFDEPHRAYARLAVGAVNAATRHVGHQPAVAREVAGVIRYLYNFAAKKNPRQATTKEPTVA